MVKHLEKGEQSRIFYIFCQLHLGGLTVIFFNLGGLKVIFFQTEHHAIWKYFDSSEMA